MSKAAWVQVPYRPRKTYHRLAPVRSWTALTAYGQPWCGATWAGSRWRRAWAEAEGLSPCRECFRAKESA